MSISSSPIRIPDKLAGRAATATPANASLHHMRLAMRDGQRFGAVLDTGRLWLTAAAGCLLQPEVGDLVLASVVGNQGYILTVLERAKPDEPAEISVPGTLRLNLPQGKLEITARHGIALDSGAGMEFSAQQWSAAFEQANVSCQTLHISGDAIQSTWQARTDVCGGTRLNIAARSETHFGCSVRKVTGHEESSAQSLRQLVDRDWTLQAGTADMNAQDRVALNADSIQIG
ncbi:DUF3540 domain-containing protein [Paralcaligenes sp. KSB-10]|uniref:DUF3540 domain-containing protein n=1 Tax=Paralcaligenes sp. KSB-10 TaxID=2901142 RepID=UPI001E5F293E|nr:DUF3540 domain-containing protein [Paralcaligenes sp. KSB-10]UHL65678.1 DUF3540 domain-containing protein [Paralcaligenes sp. KSB-10]